MWIVSNEQLLAWVQNPVPISQLDQVDALKCKTPTVDASQKICNGIPQNEAGLLSHCAFSDFPFYTCVCPVFVPPPLRLNYYRKVRMPRGGANDEQPESRTTST